MIPLPNKRTQKATVSRGKAKVTVAKRGRSTGAEVSGSRVAIGAAVSMDPFGDRITGGARSSIDSGSSNAVNIFNAKYQDSLPALALNARVVNSVRNRARTTETETTTTRQQNTASEKPSPYGESRVAAREKGTAEGRPPAAWSTTPSRPAYPAPPASSSSSSPAAPPPAPPALTPQFSDAPPTAKQRVGDAISHAYRSSQKAQDIARPVMDRVLTPAGNRAVRAGEQRVASGWHLVGQRTGMTRD